MTGKTGAPWPFNTDVTKIFETLKLPAAPDMEALLAVQRRNIEAMTQAYTVTLRAGQEVNRRHMEIMRQAMSDLGETMRAMTAPGNPQEKNQRQVELLRKAYEHAAENMREMSETIQHASTEAVEVINKRFVESLGEVKALSDKPK